MSPHERGRIGVIEDDETVGKSLVQRLELEGYSPLWWRTGQEALEGLHTERPDLAVCDIVLPDMGGEDVFLQALPQLGGKPFLFVTGFGKVEDAVRLIKAGAADYIVKPYELSDLLERIKRLIKRQPRTAGDLGTSEAMRQLEMLLRRVADIDSSLLITGESGVGKEVAAKLVHQISSRSDEPLSRSIAGLSQMTSSRDSCSATKGARSRAPRCVITAMSNGPATASFSSMRSVSCRC
jgi:DNA-binding NtrC family response regulator